MTSKRVHVVTSLSNPLVKEWTALQVRKARDAAGVFVLEGEAFVRAAVAAGWQVDTLLVDGERGHGGDDVALLADELDAARAVETTGAVLGKITRRDNPQAVVALVRQRTAPVTALQHGLWLGLDRVRDPGNLGTILRTFDASGLAAKGGGVVLIGECCDPFSPEVVRASMGSVVQVPVLHMAADEVLHAATGLQMPLFGTHVHAHAQDYRAVDFGEHGLLLLGNESAGLAAELTVACRVLVNIPMRAEVESLNLSVAAGLLTYKMAAL